MFRERGTANNSVLIFDNCIADDNVSIIATEFWWIILAVDITALS